MANGIRKGDPRGFNKGRSSKIRVGSRVRQTTEEGGRTYRPKRCGNYNKVEDNSPKNLNDKRRKYVLILFQWSKDENIIYFSFPFITQNLRMGKVQRIEDSWAAHTGAELRIYSEHFFSSFSVVSKSSWLFNIADTHKNSRHTSFSLPPTKCTRTHFFLVCHPRNFCSITTCNTCILFTLGTRWILSYFRSIKSDFNRCIKRYQRDLRVNIQQ